MGITLRAVTFSLALTVLFAARQTQADEVLDLSSPDGKVAVHLEESRDSRQAYVYRVTYGGRPIISASGLSIDLEATPPIRLSDFRVSGIDRHEIDTTYAIPVGKSSVARDHYKGATVHLREASAPHRSLALEFRASNDGIAFRYVFPKQLGWDRLTILEESTEFNLPDETIVRVLPLASFTTPYEWYYQAAPSQELPVGQLYAAPMLAALKSGGWLAITEANLTDYAGMYLARPSADSPGLVSRLSPLPGQARIKVSAALPHRSPWRVLQIGDDPGRLLESNIIFNLNEPSRIVDTSWIRPGKTTFPWWNGYMQDAGGPKPAVDTATMKYYIDFCAEQGIPYHSLDGLDIAWYGGPIAPNGPTDITRGAPSIDLPELLRYSKAKGVRLRLWMHWKALRPQIDEAFARYEQWGIEGVMVDFMDRDDQEMVNFYHEMAEKAARHRLTLTLHGAYKPTGMERTWPNVLSYEAVLNQEYNKWQPHGVKGTPPLHNLDAAFVRMLAGPLDYHQGGLRNLLPEDYKFRDVAPPVQGTRAHQLAMYVVYQNHLPMMADSPGAYRQAKELPFLVDVPCNWDETRVLEARPGQSLVIARRQGREWFIGGMAADSARDVTLPLLFLGEGKYRLELYEDDPEQVPTATKHRDDVLNRSQSLAVSMARWGGFAARLVPR